MKSLLRRVLDPKWTDFCSSSSLLLSQYIHITLIKMLYDFRQNPKKYLTIKFELF